MTAGARAAHAALRLILRTVQSSREEETPSTLLLVLLGTLGSGILLLAAVITILTSPFEYLGAAGELQTAYSGHVTGSTMQDGTLSEEEIAMLCSQLDLSDAQREALVETALSLVGRVSYFWGGKSEPGWNDEWGQLRVVTAVGSSTTGTLRPFGLDCSGFSAWVYATSGVSLTLMGRSAQGQYAVCQKIEAEELLPGDLAFHRSSSGRIDHVGLFLDRQDGVPRYIHCSFSGGGVVLGTYAGFTQFGRILEEVNLP